jgi:transposase
MKAWARELAKEGATIDWQKLLAPTDLRAFLPRRWVVEGTFSWLGQNRRMSKDYEKLSATSEAFVYVAMTHLMVKRLARACGFADSFWETVRKVIGVTL